MIPPGVIHGLAGAAVGLIRSLLWQPQRRIDASGADWNARSARDYSAEGFRRIDARDRAAAWHGALDGAGDVEAGCGAGLAWPLPEDMTDGALEAALYASRRSRRGHRRIAEPDWAGVHRELKRKHVTLLILWDEYIATSPGGYSCSRFCELYRAFEKTLSVTMRQTHAAGERLFVDYAGDGVAVVVDRLTGEIRMAQIFVAVLGTSSFTFAKATWTQALPDWIDAHVRAFEAIGGVAELVVPDNAKTAIVKASFYDPEVNRTYAEMAAH
jgi:transposase